MIGATLDLPFGILAWLVRYALWTTPGSSHVNRHRVAVGKVSISVYRSCNFYWERLCIVLGVIVEE